MIGFEITPRIHPEYGAWGTTPSVTTLDTLSGGLHARCLALQQDDRRVLWYGSDLVGTDVDGTDALRLQVADALGMDVSQIIWSTSQTHSSAAIPGSAVSGSTNTDLVAVDNEFIEAERQRLLKRLVDAGRTALDELRPADVWAGRGHCDSISYNSRLPMLLGGCKFSRDYAEGLQSDKYFDPTIGMVRFNEKSGMTIGTLFNFCCHPAVMICDKYLSSDWVGSARRHIEAGQDGAPAMYLQGFCGDVHPYYMFGTPEQATTLGERLGAAAVAALPTLVPARPEPFAYAWETIQIARQPMPSREMCEQGVAEGEAFIDEGLNRNPRAVWIGAYNAPDPDLFTPEQRAASARMSADYFLGLMRMIDDGIDPPPTYSMHLGGVRIGDVAAALSPGENLTLTGFQVRGRSPFVHTLVCGDTNGLFGYIGADEEIHRGGAETDYHWRPPNKGRFRLPPAKGSAQRVIDGLDGLLHDLHDA